MKAQIIQIGNSQGIRIPKALLEQSRINSEVELELHADGILIRNTQKPRANWNEAFQRAESDDDEFMEGPSTSFEKSEWQW